MLAGFDWWLLVVGIVAGGGLVWLLLADFRRFDADVAADEAAREADWIAGQVSAERVAAGDARGAGRVASAGGPDAVASIDRGTVQRVLELHQAYLAAPAPDLDELDDAAWYETHPDGDGVPIDEAADRDRSPDAAGSERT